MNLKKRFLFCVPLIVLFAVTAPAGSVTPNPAIEAQKLSYNQAKAAAKQNNASLVEQCLTATNSAPLGSSAWHTRMGQQLLSVVHDVPREGKSEILDQLVQMALRHFQLSFDLAAMPTERSSIKHHMAKLHERFTADKTAAIACYREAHQLNPRNVAAQRSADRLERMQQQLQERRKG